MRGAATLLSPQLPLRGWPQPQGQGPAACSRPRKDPLGPGPAELSAAAVWTTCEVRSIATSAHGQGKRTGRGQGTKATLDPSPWRLPPSSRGPCHSPLAAGAHRLEAGS